MKKVIILIFCIYISITSCFANTYQVPEKYKNQYKNEIEKTIKKEVPKTKKNIDKEVLAANKIYKKALNDTNKTKNMDKYIFLIQNYQRGIEVCDVNFIVLLIDITNKYINVNDKIPPTDYAGTLRNFIYPYFDSNNINYEQIHELEDYTARKILELDDYMQNI